MTKPIITLKYDAVGGDDLRVYEYKCEPLLKLVDALYPKLVGGSDMRAGRYFLIYTDDGLVASITGRPHKRGFTAGSIMKNPLYKGADRDAMLKAILAVQAMGGGIEEFPSETKQHNYGMLTLWHRLGLGCKQLGDKRWKSAGGDWAHATNLNGARIVAKPHFGDMLAYAQKRLAALDIPANLLPTECAMTHPADCFSIRVHA